MATEPAPKLDIPQAQPGATCTLSAIDTTCSLTVSARTLVEPVIPGHELLNLPTLAFLITHAPSGRQLLFDLGCRKDFWNLPPPIVDIIDQKVPGIKVEKNVDEVLADGGVDMKTIEAGIISHHHYDHAGALEALPKSMGLLVGPGFVESFLPGYPTAEHSPACEDAFAGRSVREPSFEDGLTVAGYRADDYFGDGSLYILDTPGHAVGHISALLRTTHDTFAFLGGDICHFNGVYRPSKYLHMPESLTPDDVGQLQRQAAMYACSLFTGCHPDKENARTTPYYQVCSSAESWYIDPPAARESVEKLVALDADDRVLVMIAHDPALFGSIPLFPRGTVNDWHQAGWKEKLRWRFLDELPIEGTQRRYLVDGTYMNGKRIKKLDGSRV